MVRQKFFNHFLRDSFIYPEGSNFNSGFDDQQRNPTKKCIFFIQYEWSSLVEPIEWSNNWKDLTTKNSKSV